MGKGAPSGNLNAKRGTPWRDAIERALAKRSRVEQHEEINRLAEALLDKALEGDLVALRELGDRLDGKAAQVIAGDADHPLQARVTVEFVKAVATSD